MGDIWLKLDIQVFYQKIQTKFEFRPCPGIVGRVIPSELRFRKIFCAKNVRLNTGMTFETVAICGDIHSVTTHLT